MTVVNGSVGEQAKVLVEGGRVRLLAGDRAVVVGRSDWYVVHATKTAVTCTCQARGMCSHIAAAMVAWAERDLPERRLYWPEEDGMLLTEKHFQAAVEQLARYTGWLIYHAWNSQHSARGFPDLCMVRDGRIVFAELKTRTGRVTVYQHEWLDSLEVVPGVEVYLWREPEAWAEIKRVLR